MPMTISVDRTAPHGDRSDQVSVQTVTTVIGDHAGTELPWGRSYAVVSPDHFRVEYAINPFMDVDDQPHPVLARRQWDSMVAALRAAGARVEVLAQRLDSPDMVYAMNLGLAVVDGEQRRFVLSHMRFDERRREALSAQPWFARRGFETSWVGRDGHGPLFEAGDAFAWGDSLLVGYGKRTDSAGLHAVAAELGVRVRGLQITHPGMYHLDLAFCPLSSTQAIVCPEALDPASARALLDLIPDPVVIGEQEALATFCANSVVIGRTVLMPACPRRVREELAARGFEVVLVDVSEFHRAGGSIRCLTNPLDVTLGRDLPRVPGGEVVLPA